MLRVKLLDSLELKMMKDQDSNENEEDFQILSWRIQDFSEDWV